MPPKSKFSCHKSQKVSCQNCGHSYDDVHLCITFRDKRRIFVNVRTDSPSTVPEKCEDCNIALGSIQSSPYPFNLFLKTHVNGQPALDWARVHEKNASHSHQHQTSKFSRKGKKMEPQPASEFTNVNQARKFVNGKLELLDSHNKARLIDALSSDNWEFLLGYRHMDPALTEDVLKVFASEHFRKSVQPAKLHKAIGVLIESFFMRNTLCRFVRCNVVAAQQLIEVHSLIDFCFRHKPEQATLEITWLSELRNKANSFNNAQLSQSCERLIEFRDQIESGVMPLLGLRDNANEEQVAPVVNVPLVPSKQDFERIDPSLIKNRVNQTSRWTSADDLINANFRLLREDYLEPMRTGLREYTNGNLDKRDMNVYENVEFMHSHTTFSHLALLVKFDANKFLKRKVEKQLPGSLLVLFPMPTRVGDALLNTEPIYATVSNQTPFNGEEIKSKSTSFLFLNLLTSSDIRRIDFAQQYLMIESPCYFKAVSPVLRTLQIMNPRTLPLQEELLLQNLDSELPQYMKQSPIVDLRQIMEPNSATIALCDVSNDVFPPQDETIFDQSQYEAMKTILTKRCALVRGPPGCGKTFVSCKLTRILHSHMQSIDDKTPILVITYTNHALDAFIEPLLPHIPNLVRVGSRSKTNNPKLENRMLNNLMHGRYSRARFHYDKLKSLQRSLSQVEKHYHRLSSMYQMGDYFDYCSRYQPELLARISDLSFLKTSLTVKEREVFQAWTEGDIKSLVEISLERMKKKKKKLEAISVQNQFEGLEDELAEEDRETTDDNAEETVAVSPQDSDADDGEAERRREFEETEAEFFSQHKDTLEELKKEGQQFTRVNHPNSSRQISRSPSDESEERKDRLEMEMHDEVDGDVLHEDDIENDDLPLSDSQILTGFSSERLWDMDVATRIRLIRKSLHSQIQNVKTEFLRTWEKLSQAIAEHNDEKEKTKFEVLSESPLIAMTSTCAALHHNLLSLLKCKICIIEEAAELMEASVLACMNDSLQHLIMIADEKQLRPKCNSHKIATKFGLEVSMFERLIRNGMAYSMILVQRRMRPTISRIVRHFYEEKLQDHPSVEGRPDIPGISHNVVFVTHKHPEQQEKRCHSNTFEAEFCVHLAEYLSKQEGFTPANITILTAYKGQFFLLKNLLRKKEHLQKVRVSTVDEYQGEENRIVILSLVRSGNELGFLKNQNRIIVALSRAREGMFILGNSELLKQSKDWFAVLSLIRNGEMGFGESLEVHCARHTDTTTTIKEAKDFLAVSHGGCQLKCEHRFICGHSCPLLCHAPSHHDKMACKKECPNHAPCGEHPCSKLCHFGVECPPCSKMVIIDLPCGHKKRIECFKKGRSHECLEQCGLKLLCGHKCVEQCSHHDRSHRDTSCNHKVTSLCKQCGRKFSFECHERGHEQCPLPCQKKVDGCGHKCSGICGTCTSRGQCEEKCSHKCTAVLICNHKCSGKHSCDTACGQCTKPCSRKCPHGVCPTSCCSEICTPCVEPCKIECKHFRCSKRCCEPCDRKRCDKRCDKKLKCKHRCMGVCGEKCPPCPKCDTDFFNNWKCPLSLLEKDDLTPKDLLFKLGCRHVVLVDYLDQHMLKTLDKDGHLVVQQKCCPQCRQVIQLADAPRYEKVIRTHCLKIDDIKRKILDRRMRQGAIEAVQQGYGAGRWFQCANGHPYFIGECGGAMEESNCADCGCRVGGTSHRLKSDNRLAGDIDGATVPAWPTMLNR
uniref:RZ-type domain-containing protein n=1 Tax=Percolomonas cosmopolitus TaxID=63605 RepID=A0A7S1PFG7_9EUKA|mmetsp:Transcript_11159/g.41694  ORF Transcript_11159/g.41694 Transcript_11159/m.41694 type:complete len:1716 (+) Transcript_11159:1336-6483(+)